MPILDPNALEFISRSVETTRRLGLRLGSLLQTGDVLHLNGDLGAGKTTLVQGLAQGWGSADPVSSPTFVLVNLYRRADGAHLYHLDAYRLAGDAEALDLDLDVLLSDGPLVVEWAERIEAALPAEGVQVHFQLVSETQRDLVLRGMGKRGQQILAALRRQMYGVA